MAAELAASGLPATHTRWINDWQHDFPVTSQPYHALALATSAVADDVMAFYRQALDDGRISRIGGVFAHGAGGDAMLVALAVPDERLEAVALQVSSHASVNHNYEREAEFNLWFVVTGPDRAAVEAEIDSIERESGLKAIRLPMVRPYCIDLGFDLAADRHASRMRPQRKSCDALLPSDFALAALVEQGLPICDCPFAHWAEWLGTEEREVIDRLRAWIRQGQLKRFGVVVRHHELGFDANAMTVFDVPDEMADELGARLALQPGVTLAYRRMRHGQWHYNLYAMVHGRRREDVVALIDLITVRSGLKGFERRVLFSRRRFKQTGGRRFAAAIPRAAQTEEMSDVVSG
ncbi:Lrp/AsnC family transcriptional regulator [Hydrogenophaga sp. 5NK40-0174]|uniref:siroheme decarboxylase subunit beta n=1 Tax=Hydrogenophaga sp. 5NK40-0174 TaxID=3127649 RepID=UPI003108FF36